MFLLVGWDNTEWFCVWIKCFIVQVWLFLCIRRDGSGKRSSNPLTSTTRKSTSRIRSLDYANPSPAMRAGARSLFSLQCGGESLAPRSYTSCRQHSMAQLKRLAKGCRQQAGSVSSSVLHRTNPLQLGAPTNRSNGLGILL